MKRLLLIGASILALLPNLAFAQATSCSANGYTVVFVNGIFDTKLQAQNDEKALIEKLPKALDNQSVNVQLAYNPSHLAGLGDLAETISQMLGGSITDVDLHTILNEMAPEVTTRKLLIVGHSQGAIYANQIYWYLLNNGEPKDAVTVYDVAAPTSTVAGNGKYLNGQEDSLLVYLQSNGFKILQPNVDFYAPAKTDFPNLTDWPGHSFADDYLPKVGERITSDIDGELINLQPSYAGLGNCFTPPGGSLSDLAWNTFFAVADPTAIDAKIAIQTTAHGAVVAFNTGKAVASIIVGAVVGLQNAQINIASSTQAAANSPDATVKGFEISKQLYGSSLTPQDVKDLLGNDQGSAVALALGGGVVEGTSTAVSTTTVPAPTSTPTVAAQTLAATSTATSTQPYVDPNFFNWLPGGGGGAAPDAAPQESDTVDDTSSTTLDDASTTPSVAADPLFTDNFDAFDGTGWQVPSTQWNTRELFAFDDGSTGNCLSGGCLSASNSGTGGLGTLGTQPYMYETVNDPQPAGSFMLWAKAAGSKSGANVGLCAEEDTACASPYQFGTFMPNDGVWRPYFFAWRQGASSVEACMLVGDSDEADCQWSDTGFPLGTNIGGLLLAAFAPRPDLGDGVWLDEMHALDAGNATLTINNSVANAGGDTKSADDFTFLLHDGASSAVASNEALTVPAGVYKVSETPVIGYAPSYGGDCDQNGYLVIEAGENKTCAVVTTAAPRLTPVADNFDADATNTPLAGQGSWQEESSNDPGAWQVVDDAVCESGNCIRSNVINESTTLLASNEAANGELSFDLNLLSSFNREAGITLTDMHGTDVGGGIVILPDNDGFKITNGSLATLFGGISLGAWHTVTIKWFEQASGCEAYASLDGSAPSDLGAVSCGVGGVRFFNGLLSTYMYVDNVQLQ